MLKRLTNKYRIMPIQLKASLWFLICAFLQKGISFITTPIFTRLLTTSEYGQFSQFMSWSGILSVLVTLNLFGGVYARGLVKFENEREIFSSALQGLTLTLVVIWTIIYLIFHSRINIYTSLTTFQMLMMFTIMWTSAIFAFWSMEQRVDFKYRKLVIITICVSVIKPILGIILVITANDKVTSRIFGLTIVEIVMFTPLFISQMRRGRRFFDIGIWKHALVFNIPLVPHYLSMSVLNGADRIMIGRMVSDAAAGIYSLAYSVSMVMTMFNTALIQTFEPWLYKKIKKQEIDDISKVAYPAFILIASVNILLIAFAPEAVAVFAPSEYYDAIYVIPPVAMSVYFMFSYTFFAVFEFYYEKTKLVAVASMAGAVLNIILNYIFISIFGYYAAGYTTLFCYIVYAGFHFHFMSKICKQELPNKHPYNLRVFIGISMVFMLVGFAIMLTYVNIVMRYICIGGIAFSIVLFRKRIIKFFKMILNTRKEIKE